MSGFSLRLISGLLLSLTLVACGGGGGGGGEKPKPASSSSSSIAPVDTDGDGRPDISDAFPNDPKEWADTDKDGVGDNSDAFPNDPTETKDSDGDGVGDNKDLFPNDATETVDTDKDGIGDNSDPDPMGQPIPAWTTYQGDAKHTGRVDVTLATSNFKQRWNKALALTSSTPGAAGDGYIFFNNGGSLIALDARNGETLWSQTIGDNSFYSFDQPAYADGIVYVQTGGHENAFLWAFNAATGSLVFQTPLEDQWSNFYAPTIVDGTVYIGGGYYGGMYAIDAKTGQRKWWQTLNQYDEFTPAVSGNYAIAYTGEYSPKLTVADRLTGNVEFEILDPEFDWGGWSMNLAPVVAGDYVLANYRGRLVAFNLASKTLAWTLNANDSGNVGFSGQPVVKGDKFYIINKGVLETRVIATGALVSSITGTSSFIGDPLVTNNLLFVRTQQSTFAYQLDTGAQAWTLSGKSGGMLMAEGALVIFTGSGVVTIDLEGDIDADGLPDWWEKRMKKNLDPTADRDGDGLTELEEFNLSTNPLLADTDGDGLLDGEEAKGTSSPRKVDTDGDGLSDYAEVKTYLTDPTKVDSDGDSLIDTEEIAAGLDPLDGNDALADNDGDGFTNLHEVRANTGVNNASDLPQMKDWTVQTGNNQRNRYSPALLDSSRFSERWTATSYQSLSAPLTAGEKLMMRTSSDQYVAWDSGTGAELWRHSVATNSVGSPATHAGKLGYFSSSNSESVFNLIDGTTGTNLLSKSIGSYSGYNSLPLLSDNTLYTIDSDNRRFKAYSLATGNLLWTSATGSTYYYGSNPHLLSNGQLIAVGSNSLTIFATGNGSLTKTITLSGSGISQAILGSKDNVILQTQDGKLSSVNLSDGSRTWVSQACQGARVAVGNGRVYLLGQTKLCVFNEQTGVLSWSLDLPYNWSSNSLVLTASHLFYSDGNSTFGIDLTLKSVTWSIAKGASEMALGADGTLYLLNGSSVTAIDTEGDTDADGLPQWWERRYGGDLVASGDPDADGLTNLQEFTAKTNPLVADTDGDGLSDSHEVNITRTNPLAADTDKDGLDDGAEVNTYGTNPLLTDSDGDGIDDAREIALGLDASDEDDATEDSDSDGFSNREEVYSGTAHNNAASKPAASDWAMTQANAAHNGFQAYRLDEDNFGLRWSKSFSLPIYPIATGDNHVFVVQGNNYSYSDGNGVFSLNAVDGKQEWKQDLAQVFNLGAPTYSAGQVVLQASSPTHLRRFDADTGTAAANISLGNSFYANQYAPSLLGNNAYTHGSTGIVATRLDTGATLWNATVSASGSDIAVNDQYLFYTYNTQIRALTRSTGAAAFSIDTQTSGNPNLVLGSRNNILAHQIDLVSYDIATRRVNWRIADPYYNYGVLPVAANGQVLYLSDGRLTSVDEIDGKPRWSWRPDNEYLSSNIVATLSHIFVANGTTTYALSAATGELLWSYSAGGQLALGADGALYIQANQRLVAINLEGDSDNDGMPDWWERHYGLDANDAGDATLDLDADGLTNLEEFNQGTYADQADSDGDSLTDAEEVNDHLTDPTNSDSDADGMSDDWELANSFDPLDAADRDLDTDGDTVPNYFEYLVGTDPNDALSLPTMFSAGVYSFEGADPLAGWTLSSETTDVSISLSQASDGSKSLQLRNKADISFTGFFSASDLSLDVKSGCGSSYIVEVYVDDQLASRISASSQWATAKTVIPLGMHTVSIRSNSYSCAIYLDNLIIAPAKTNTELGIQFVGMYNNEFAFVDAAKTVVRRIGVRSPLTSLRAQALTTLGNEKVLVAFSGSETRLGVLDLATFNWRYFGGIEPLVNYYSNTDGEMVAGGNFAYVATLNSQTNSGQIARVNLTSGAVSTFGSHVYNSLALDSAGYIYAHSNGVVYKYDPATLALVSQANIVSAQQIQIDSEDRLIVSSYNEVVRYNAQRLIDQRVAMSSYSARSIALNGRDELLVATQNNQIIWYSADWQRSQILTIPAETLASFPQPDSDSDGLPDWWEMAHGLNLADSADADLDIDSDGLTALEEFAADTDPTLDDTDGDLVTDGDEVKTYGSNPNNPDTDADGLTDAEEVDQYFTNPLVKDTDADSISDFLEVTHFLTDPNDATSKPAALVNFVESFENTVTGWVTAADANAGWTVVSDSFSSGSKSLRSGVIGDGQKAAVEWAAVFNPGTLNFDARVSSESCCDNLEVYVDGVRHITVQTYDQWQTQNLTMTAGFHTIKFVYRKDGSAASGSDAVWIDNIRVQ